MNGFREELGRLLAETAGLDPATTGPEGLDRAVEAIARRTGTRDEGGILSLLRGQPENLATLLEDLVVPETWFFRDGEPFLYLGDLARDRLAEGNRRVRVLSAPCASGEEAYSALMVLLHAGYRPADVEMDAVDISRRAVEKARKAGYGKRSFREPGWENLTNRWFTRRQDRLYLAPEVASLASFQVDNLNRPDFFFGREPYDFIFCRNLVIYLAEEARARVVRTVRRLLAPDGTLFVGHAEMIFFCRNGFEPVPRPRAFACRTEGLPTTTATPGRPSTAPLPPPPDRPVGRAPAAPAHRPRREGPPRLPAPSPPAAPPPPPAETGPDPVGAIRSLADRGQLRDAEHASRALLQKGSASAEIYCLLGTICAARGDLADAETAFQRAVYLEPECYEALVQLSLILEGRGETDAAARLRERARKNFPGAPR
ncbi:MAG: tetratricopeptide repeat protein [Acidobacteria bacterium]|nr:tetratricopeptide repeat protein [Acidobacteriota bacterium]